MGTLIVEKILRECKFEFSPFEIQLINDLITGNKKRYNEVNPDYKSFEWAFEIVNNK